MINLLPEFQKKKLRTEYILRFFSVLFVFTSVVMVSAIIFLFPSYFISQLDEKTALDKVKIIRQSSETDEIVQINIELKVVQQKLGVLSKSDETVSISELTNAIISHAKGITINGFSYAKSKDNGAWVISISGIANKREDLRAFEQNLEKDENFSEVELPVSNLAKDRDINFNIKAEGVF